MRLFLGLSNKTIDEYHSIHNLETEDWFLWGNLYSIFYKTERNIFGLISVNVNPTDSNIFILHGKDINSLISSSRELEAYNESVRFENSVRKKYSRYFIGNSDLSY